MTSLLTRLGRLAVLRLLAAFVFAVASAGAQALEIKPYSDDALARLQADGKPVALHFHADWCGTCTEQDKALKVLGADRALAPMNILVVDYDRAKDLRRKLKVTSQSTFVVYKGTTEVAREGGQTQPDAIRQLLSRAL